MDESMDRFFAALGDRTRLRLLEALTEHEPLTTAELCARFPISRWAVMKHLAVLRTAGLVETLPQGRRRLHYLDRRRLADARVWLERTGGH